MAKATAWDMTEAYILACHKLKHPYYRHLINPECEGKAISMIKCVGRHIGDPEAKIIYKKILDTKDRWQ